VLDFVTKFKPVSPTALSFNSTPVFAVVIGTVLLAALKIKLIAPAVVFAVVTGANFLFALVAKIAVTARTRVAVVKNIFDFFI
jgi:hypothetical protein